MRGQPLSDTHHPFLVHLRFAFQSPSKLYLVMDYCNGGEPSFFTSRRRPALTSHAPPLSAPPFKGVGRKF